ncbi:hypothetical protein ZWY2020_019081 [Hordeum vulgare]|nr:hypothetical protein ZWY2020_019081 [Hordeum vulgare]
MAAEAANREEAERALRRAEEHFLAGNVAGARRLAAKARRISPSLPGAAHALAAYDVHAAAAGTQHRAGYWHDVLGVARSASASAVKKQFRRLSLLVHPDKNRSAAAEGAFKLLAQACDALSSGSGAGAGYVPYYYTSPATTAALRAGVVPIAPRREAVLVAAEAVHVRGAAAARRRVGFEVRSREVRPRALRTLQGVKGGPRRRAGRRGRQVRPVQDRATRAGAEEDVRVDVVGVVPPGAQRESSFSAAAAHEAGDIPVPSPVPAVRDAIHVHGVRRHVEPPVPELPEARHGQGERPRGGDM